jgi:hypothetical protein
MTIEIKKLQTALGFVYFDRMLAWLERRRFIKVVNKLPVPPELSVALVARLLVCRQEEIADENGWRIVAEFEAMEQAAAALGIPTPLPFAPAHPGYKLEYEHKGLFGGRNPTGIGGGHHKGGGSAGWRKMREGQGSPNHTELRATADVLQPNQNPTKEESDHVEA